MNEQRNPELRQFESELRQLRPVEVEYRLPGPSRRPNQFLVAGGTVAVLAASLLIVVVGLQTPMIEETPDLSCPEPVSTVLIEPSNVVERKRFPGTNMRKQLASILAEYEVENPIPPTHKPEYPVVEIVVSEKPATISPEQRHALQNRMKLQESLNRDLNFDRL